MDTVGWDIGGAHLKVAWLGENGQLNRVAEIATPLWRGLAHLDQAISEIGQVIPLRECRHRVTMTGELVDAFRERAAGVVALTQRMIDALDTENVRIYAGPTGFIEPSHVRDHYEQVASANWYATASLLATRLPAGLLLDVGSTTSDIILLHHGRVMNKGFTDRERLASEELIYTGVVRTSLMAVSQRAPFRGEWISLANEHFATTADVYRILKRLPQDADLHDSADGQGKSIPDSMVRLARMIGADAADGEPCDWQLLASYFVDRQLDRLALACLRRRSVCIDGDAPLVGAGVGRFVVEQLAQRLGWRYRNIERVMGWHTANGHSPADCAPAIAVAELAYKAEARSRAC